MEIPSYLTKKMFENIKSAIANRNRLNTLSDEELVMECAKTGAADYDVVIVMMNRLYPGWEDAQDKPED